jgi:hypothetical protein
MLHPEVLFVPPPRIISAIHEHSVLILAWMGLGSENSFIAYDTILRFDMSSSQKPSIMVDYCFVRVGVISLK